jgi:ferritin
MKTEKLSKEVVDLLIERIAGEFSAFALYRSATNWLSDQGFMKASAFFKAESDDELKHAKTIEDLITGFNVIFELPCTGIPDSKFKNLADVLQKAYDMEYELYQAYEDLSAKILEMGELSTFQFLMTFLEIQRNSVIEYSDKINILDKTNLDDKFQMLMLQEQLFG